MKRKTIEKIPYIGLEDVVKKEGAKYVGITALKDVGNEPHLFMEVYRNGADSLDVPVVRVVLTGKDFGTYFTGRGEWSRAMISDHSYYRSTRPVWEKAGTEHDAWKASVLWSEDDLERIKDFTGVKEKSWRKLEWWEYMSERMWAIADQERRDREHRKRERRRQALKDREQNTPQLPEGLILEYADRVLFQGKHYLYYKKHGVRVRVACSKCGGVTERRWKPGISYESQFEAMTGEPMEGLYGTCPMCGAIGEWKPQGKVKGQYGRREFLFLGQKYKGTGMVFRYIQAEKGYLLGLACEGDKTVMVNACEEVSAVELARAYFEEGKEPQTDFHKSDPYLGKNFWDDCNIGYVGNIRICSAPVMGETYENMKGTFLQYCAMKEYDAAEGGRINPVDYAERYTHTPQIEMLVKLGLPKVVEKLVAGYYGIVKDSSANRVDQFLGIRKEHVRQLIRHRGAAQILEVLQMEERMGKQWTEEQVEDLAELDPRAMTNGLQEVLGHMGVQKMLNLISRYAGAGYGTGCSKATSRLQEAARTYFDYIGMRKDLGYDLANTVFLMPGDLAAAHREMVLEKSREAAERRIREVLRRFPLVKKHYRRLRKNFYYGDSGFLIRPARDAGEIVMEGRLLHHCVGGDSYLQKHNDGVTVILFLRRKKEPEEPYITVEVRMEDLKVLQWHGEYDTKPDKKKMDRWLDIYATKLKCGLAGAQEGPGDESGQQVPAATTA